MTDKKPKILLLQISVIVALVGFIAALYLYFMDISKAYRCIIHTGIFECDTVGQSIYSKLPPGNGISVSLLGCLFYLAIITMLFLAIFTKNEYWLSFALPVASIVGVLFSIYLTAIEIFVIKKFCEFCLTSAFCTVALLVLVIIAKKQNFPSLLVKLDFWNMFKKVGKS